MANRSCPTMRAKRAATLEQTDWHIWGYSSFRRKHLIPSEVADGSTREGLAAAAKVDHRRLLPQRRAVQAWRRRRHRGPAPWLCLGNLSVAWQTGCQAVHRPAVDRGDRHRRGPDIAGGAGLAGGHWADRLRP